MQKIGYCKYGMPNDNHWAYDIVFSNKKETYRADLWGPNYDDFDWYSNDDSIQESSPEFTTKQEAIDYAEKEWIVQNHVITTGKIDNCVIAQPDKNDEWHYEIVFLSNESTYRADLYGPNYDDTNWQDKDAELLRSSPEFSSLEDAIFYALKEWEEYKE